MFVLTEAPGAGHCLLLRPAPVGITARKEWVDERCRVMEEVHVKRRRTGDTAAVTGGREN